MPKKTAKAFSPAGISSFFEICDKKPNGQPISDLEKVGAVGGGFVIQKGVHTKVEVEEANANNVEIFIDGTLAPEAKTTHAVADALLAKNKKKFKVTVKHEVEVPIGAGFGSSAAGALGAALALSKAFELKLTYNELGRIAHTAEVKCKTGLGTVGPIMLGGCILTIEPGGPGIGVIDRLPLSSNYVVVAGTFESVLTKHVLMSDDKKDKINYCGRKTLQAILKEPSLENFLAQCLNFAEETGFMTARTTKLARLATTAGAIGAAQNMMGEAVHAITSEGKADDVIAAFRQMLPREKILVSELDFQGARLVEQ